MNPLLVNLNYDSTAIFASSIGLLIGAAIIMSPALFWGSIQSKCQNKVICNIQKFFIIIFSSIIIITIGIFLLIASPFIAIVAIPVTIGVSAIGYYIGNRLQCVPGMPDEQSICAEKQSKLNQGKLFLIISLGLIGFWIVLGSGWAVYDHYTYGP